MNNDLVFILDKKDEKLIDSIFENMNNESIGFELIFKLESASFVFNSETVTGDRTLIFLNDDEVDILKQKGFDLIYLGDANKDAHHLDLPDDVLLTYSELVTQELKQFNFYTDIHTFLTIEDCLDFISSNSTLFVDALKYYTKLTRNYGSNNWLLNSTNYFEAFTFLGRFSKQNLKG